MARSSPGVGRPRLCRIDLGRNACVVEAKGAPVITVEVIGCMDTTARSVVIREPEWIHSGTVASLWDSAPWLHDALKSIGDLESLPSDWDTYGSPPIPLAAIEGARRLLGALKL